MVNFLYAVAAITCALIMLILPARTRRNLSRENAIDRSFLVLETWTVVFCLADGIWGVLASDVVMNDLGLVVASFFFHLFAAVTPLVWLQFVLTYLNIKHYKYYISFALLMFAAEVVILVMNFFQPLVYSVNPDGTYQSEYLRPVLFYVQYITYVVIAVAVIIRLIRHDSEQQGNVAVLAFVASPILCGIFQLMYPDAPAYSIGYTLGCCLIYSYVISDMLEARLRENLQMSSASKAKTAFLNSMSHDIRTPLNAITGFNNMALKALGKDDDKVRDYLEKTGRSADNLLTIINDILEISRIEAGKITMTEDKGKVQYSFANIEPMMREIARTAGIDLTFSIGKIDDEYVVCDFAHCARVFTNLISNAIKYTPKGGKVQVRCEQTGRRADGFGLYTYTFEDNGIGMSEEFQKRLFEPFSREQTSTVSKIQGTGLGLALCKNLVEVMGGTISCVSQQGKGSCFTVTLPFRIQEGQEFVDPENGDAAWEKILESKKILLVEDNELNREIASSILEEMGAKVSEAADGAIAVEIMRSAEADAFDLILMDIQMPIIDGYEATRQIRALGTPASRIPIVAMTANAYDEDRRLALAAGMNAHLSKPIDIDLLRETLSRLLF